MTESSHVWIGVDFRSGGSSLRVSAPVRAGKGHVSVVWARTAVGQAQRLAQAVPEAQPWAAALWAALAGPMQAAERGKREAPPGRLPAVRFVSGAWWMLALPDRAILPLARTLTPDANSLIASRAPGEWHSTRTRGGGARSS